jgi:hypothetical protein
MGGAGIPLRPGRNHSAGAEENTSGGQYKLGRVLHDRCLSLLTTSWQSKKRQAWESILVQQHLPGEARRIKISPRINTDDTDLKQSWQKNNPVKISVIREISGMGLTAVKTSVSCRHFLARI